MFAIFRLFSMVGTIVAFFRTPMGRQLIERSRMFLSKPANREKASALANRVRQPRRSQT